MASKEGRLIPFEQAKEAPQADWLAEQESFYIALMKEVVISRGDSRAAGKFSKQEWLGMMKKYYAKWGLKYNAKAFKNKYTNLKERFREFKELIEESSGLEWHSDLVTVNASVSWWEEYVKNHPKAKQLKRLRLQGCPEYKDLEVIFGETISKEHLQASVHHDYSTDEEDNHNEETTNSPVAPNTEVLNDQNDQSSQSKNQTRVRKRARKDDCVRELPEAIMLLAEASRARVETRDKFTISECIDVIESMNVEIGRVAYTKVMNLLQSKGWREAFLHMPDARRRDVLKCIEDGDFEIL